MAAFEPTLIGIFIFGIIAGICPCNSVLCLGLVGYIAGSEKNTSFLDNLKLMIPFAAGTIIILLPLGLIAGIMGDYLLLINESVAWAFGGLVMILMGLQLLKIYKPPIKSIFNMFKGSKTNTAAGTFLLGLSFGAITIGRGAPMLLAVITYIGLYQGPLQGLGTMLLYSTGMVIPLALIGSAGGTISGKLKDMTSRYGNYLDTAIGLAIILIGLYFIYLAL
ncbi:cytochrome C biogenesis protein CcdA [Methanocella sp. CWC-04]|uniref:Cytochrome C biogenesis protein CcdA n=1 Tax=Methanooceanicella nereidis TaxID=2052831 RepID=A0AAP2REH3_9EURY|nr:cytochrome c biogenesis protein CcdA [Methanocella sp. CWC-04]MCD1295687.1 cytochrome C biogenesis protein CcdA [Methanocella sp. CWC-04]